MTFINALTYITWDISPDIFTIPIINHPLRWYGLFFAFAFLISQQIMYFIYKKEERPVKEIDTLTVYLVVATIVGARLGHVLFYDPIHYFQNPHQIFMIWEGGLASHGGVIGVLLGSYLFARKTNVSYLWALDRITIVAALTFSMIRLGNLMNSEMIGVPTNLPWAFIFTSRDGIPRHPAQLYEAIFYFTSFVILFSLWFKLRHRMKNGFLIGWSLIILFALRFIAEFFKMNQVEFENELILNMGQLLSIPFMLAGVAILISIIGKGRESFSPDTIVNNRDEIKNERTIERKR